MALLTLRAIALGGMRDHVGGGFHRYSVDADWRVPHFEKMLYDQAQLTLAYVEAAQLTGEPFYSDVAADTLAYVRRDLTHSDGGFYSAEDADSVPPEHADEPSLHKSEGAFYIWRSEEIAAAAGSDADIVRMRYGILPDGNAPFDPQSEFTHRNLLYTARSIDDIAALTGQSPDEVDGALARARAALLAVRSTRPRPYLDDKILTAWNGLMIAAFARAGRVLGQRSYVEDARRAAGFLPRASVGACHTNVAAAVPARRGGSRCLRGRLRVSDVRPARAVSGRWRSRVARVGPRAAAAAGRPVLGPGGRRLVQHDRTRSVRPAQAEGGPRRRGAGRQFGSSAEPADALASHGFRVNSQDANFQDPTRVDSRDANSQFPLIGSLRSWELGVRALRGSTPRWGCSPPARLPRAVWCR